MICKYLYKATQPEEGKVGVVDLSGGGQVLVEQQVSQTNVGEGQLGWRCQITSAQGHTCDVPKF